ncbi:MAG TPA: mechanosensitive ion channel family protein [Thermoanaerobaculia bacterium]
MTWRTRLARLGVPLVVSAALFVVYWFFRQNPGLFTDTHLDRRSVLRVLLFVAWAPLIFALVRALDLVTFDMLVSRRGRVRAPVLLREIVSIVLYVMLFGWTISTIFEYRITALLATGTVLAAVLGLALQETLGNLFAGIALHLEDSFELGDVIRSGDYFGTVEAVRWRGTRLRTFNNNLVIVPNSLLARERLEVFPRNNLNARVLPIGIDYHVPPATVINVLVQAAANVEGVARDAPVIARVGSFGDSSLTYEIKYYTIDYSQRDRIDAEIRRAVWYALRRNAISIPYPVRSVVRYQAPADRHVAAPEEILERLAGIDILSPLPDDARETIAGAARVHVYAKGETIIRHGTAGDSMFVVHEGSVSVRVGGEEIARLQPGDFFGEMALLTGETRTADVVALTDVMAVEIAKPALQPVLAKYPDLADAISARVAERRGRLDSHRSDTREEPATILSKIRAYFGL